MRLLNCIALVLGVLLVACGVLGADGGDDDFQRRLAEVRTAVFKGETTHAAKAAAFERAAADAAGDTQMQAALLAEAFSQGLAGLPNDECRKSAERALKRLEAIDPERKNAWAGKRIDLLRRAHQRTTDKMAKLAAAERLLKAIIDLARDQEAARDWSGATRSWSEASRMAKLLGRKDSQKITQAYGRARAFASRRQTADRLTKALVAKPDATSLRNDLLYILVVDLDEPGEASGHLNADLGEGWRTYLPAAAGLVDDLQATVARQLGDWYSTILVKRARTAQSRSIVLSRAVGWYKKAISLDKDHEDALLAKIAVGKISKTLAPLPPAPAPRKDKPPKAASSSGQPFAISVTEPWPYKRSVLKGQKLRVTASGRWRILPRGKWHGPGSGSFFLRGRLDEGQPFRVGADLTIEIKADGVLHLGMFEGGKYSNNRGSITVKIEIVK